uniref:Uncharacterized protein n=1 Tax=Arundo donax TaxID=35708 RepID=A0A0A9DA14_ARUDO
MCMSRSESPQHFPSSTLCYLQFKQYHLSPPSLEKEEKYCRQEKVAGKTTTKKKKVPVPHDSPVIGTKNKTPQNPALHNRSKRRILESHANLVLCGLQHSAVAVLLFCLVSVKTNDVNL